MPYKDKKKQAAYMKKYRTPYMKKYREFKKKQMEQLEKAIRRGDTNLAKQILNTKPSDFWGLGKKGHKRKATKRNSKSKR